jgi:carboxypeptidase C (cathepsin A)
MRSILLAILIACLCAEEENLSDLSITNHTIELESGPLSYTAITGMCPTYGEKGKEANLFFISFTKDDEEERPLTFVFPGGPGAAGTIESILTFGPRRLLTAGEGRTIHPPYRLIDNPQTLLEYTDLVFVDPVDCGFSKIEGEADPKYYFSLEGDLQILGEFIHSYIDISERWNSPIYLSGISYGTLRCCGLADNLLQYGIPVKGVILSGCAFNYSTLDSERDKAMPDWLLVPTFAATAWYHKRLWPEKSLEEVVDYARRFTYDELAPYMLQPARLSYVEKIELEKKLAHLTGLPIDTVKRYNLRINEKTYTAEFFGPQRKILGGVDTRYSGDIACIDPFQSHDPSYLDSLGTAPAFNHYLQTELDTHFPLSKYVGFSLNALKSWNFGSYDSFGEPNLLQRLRHVMIINPMMKVFVGSGYFDCRTPFAATEFCFEHLDLPPSYIKNIHFKYYEAGHGHIFDFSALKKWKSDLTQFYSLE